MSPTPKPWEMKWDGSSKKPWEMGWGGAPPADSQPKPPEQPGAVKHLLGKFYDYTIGPAVQAVTHPRETILNTVGATVDAVQNPGTALKRIAGGAAVPIPIEVLERDVPGAAGAALGTVASAVVPGAVKAKAPAIVSGAQRTAGAVKAGVKAAAPDVAAGATKAAAGAIASEVLPGGPIKYAAGAYPVYTGTRQIARGVTKGVKAGREAFRGKIAAATEKMAAAEVSPGQAFAETQGISAAEYAALAPEERAMFDNAAKAQTARPPVGAASQDVVATPAAEGGPTPPAVVEGAPRPSGGANAKTLTDMLREELEAKRAAQPQAPAPQPPPAPAPKHQHPQRLPEGFTRAGKLDPSEGNWTGSRPLPRTAADYAPRPVAVESPAVAPPEAPPLPRTEVIQPQPAAPAAVEPVAPTLPPTLAQQSPTSPTVAPTPAPTVANVAPTLNPVEIGRRIMRSMGMEDVPAKDALQTFQNLQELAARTGQPIEAVFQKYTGEPLAGVAAPPAPKVSITLDDFGPHAGRSFDKFAKTYEGFADTAARDRLLGLAEQISKADGKKPELRHLMEAMQYEGAAVAEGVGTGADLLRSLADGVDPSKGKVFTDAQYRGGGIIGGERARRIMGEGSPAPRPITPKQGEAAMFRTKEAQAPVNPNLDPNETRTFTAASGEGKSKALRAEEKKVYNADAKAKRFAEAFHAEGVTAEDVANLTAADAKVLTDGLIAKGLLKKGEMPPNSSLPRLIRHLKELEKQAKAAPKR
jgi:hypothetical protein